MSQPQTLRRTTVKVASLTHEVKREMFDLFEKYYDHVSFDRFLSDLNEKTHVFFFHERTSKRLVGFSTIFRKSIPSLSPGIFLFSGDTVIHEDYWGSKALQKSFFWFILESKLLSPFAPLYWMLMSKGVKTYLMMRKNFKQSYPNRLGDTPEPYRSVLKDFYQQKFPKDFKADQGLILFQEKMGSVKNTIEPHSQRVLKNPEAMYFFTKNPKWEEGEELACCCEIRFSDFLFHVFKFFIPVLDKNR